MERQWTSNDESEGDEIEHSSHKEEHCLRDSMRLWHWWGKRVLTLSDMIVLDSNMSGHLLALTTLGQCSEKSGRQAKCNSSFETLVQQ